MLNQQQQQSLLTLAKVSIQDRLNSKRQLRKTNDPDLMVVRGVFVSLYIEDQLRGCLGHINGNMPLYHEVQDVAPKSAFEDTRFEPVTISALDKLKIEVSVISPIERIYSPQQVKVGEHGLVLKNGEKSSLFLPHVPLLNNWNLATYVEELCKKATLSTDILDDPKTELYRFTAEIFS
jgi:AmmeMemoRadiSam system protein A